MFRIERGTISQLYFRVDQFSLTFDMIPIAENLSVGSSACDVLETIVKSYPQVAALQLVFYNEETHSFDNDFADNTDIWLPRDLISQIALSKISLSNFKESKKQVLMAIGSRVTLEGGNHAHIPMVDFDSKNYGLEEVVGAMSLMPGVILDSGDSYHYWGFGLLSTVEWNRFMTNLISAENHRREELKRKPFYDLGFLESSIEKNRTALRIFGYPGTQKPTEPRVVALIK